MFPPILPYATETRLFSGYKMNTAYHPFKSEQAKRQFLELYDATAEKWPIISETSMIDTSFGKTFVRISGQDNAEPLVLLHGVGGNSLQWIPNIEALSKEYRTYAVDNIYDNGRSVYTQAVESPDDFVKWLNELFTALELGNNIRLVGLSYGGWISTQYALHSSNRLHKVVLLAPVGTILPLSPQWIIRAVLCAVPHRYFTKRFLYWLMENLAQKDEASRAFIEEYIDESYTALKSFKSKRMVNPTVLTDEQLHRIDIPTLYLVGENEKIYSASKAMERFQKAAPHIKAEMIPDAGHDLTMVQAEMVNQKILDFLRG